MGNRILTLSEIKHIITSNHCAYHYDEQERIMHIIGVNSIKCQNLILEQGKIPFSLQPNTEVATITEIEDVVKRFKCSCSVDKSINTLYIFGTSAMFCKDALLKMGGTNRFKIVAKAVQLMAV